MRPRCGPCNRVEAYRVDSYRVAEPGQYRVIGSSIADVNIAKPGNADEAVVIDLVLAFADADTERVGELLAEELVAHVTNPDGSTREVQGRANYLAIIDAMDPVSASLRLDIPQIATIEPGLVLAMVEVHAQRNDRTLHNFSGQLFRVVNGVVSQCWMVEALPAQSDEFWSAPNSR